MKLQKLIIHNIASIEDATIDFEAKPLSDSDVFLITGKTGSGKSTILDAICLALYNKTPRLGGRGGSEFQDGNAKVYTANTEQILRRNTVEGHVELTFTGNDNTPYKSYWGVHRAHNIVDGNYIQKLEFQNLKTEKVFSGTREVSTAISNVIGLNFDQFCRTVMLAQGDFTRFLKSEDKDKAEILQKITGADIYEKIGKKIADTWSAKKKDYESARERIEGIVLLTEEEKQSRKDESARCKDAHDKLTQEGRETGNKIGWLQREANLGKNQEQAQQKYDQAQESVHSQTYKDHQVLLKNWRETNDVRSQLSRKHEASERKAQALRRLQGFLESYKHLLAGRMWLEDCLHTLDQDITKLEESLQVEQDKVPVYNNYQTINAHVKTYTDNRTRIAQEEAEIGRITEHIEKTLKPAKTQADQQQAEDCEALTQEKAKLEQEKEKLQKADLPGLRKQKDNQQMIKVQLTTAQTDLNTWQKEKARDQKSRKDLADLGQEIERIKQSVKDAEPGLNLAKGAMEGKKEALEKQKETIDDWAKSMRSKLRIGDVCPVCQQKITSEIPHEDALDALFRTAEEDYRQAEQKYNDLKEQQNKRQSDIIAQEQLYKRQQSNIEKDHTLANAEKALRTSLEACGIEAMDESTGSILTQRLEQVNIAIGALTESITQAEAIESRVKDFQKQVDRCQASVEKSREKADKAEKNLTDASQKIKTQQSLIESQRTLMASAEEEISRLIGEIVLECDWRADSAAFIAYLERAAKKHKKDEDRLNSLKTTRIEMQGRWARVQTPLDKIAELMPAWKDVEVTEAKEVRDLEDASNRLQTQVQECQNTYRLNEDNERAAVEQVQAYLQEHPEMRLEYLEQLSERTDKEMGDIEESQKKIDNAVISCKAALDQVKNQMAEHIGQKPAMEAGDTLESLQQKATDIEQKKQEASQRIGAITNELDTDARNRTQSEQLRQEAEAKKKLFEQWDKLYNLLGDGSGAKFRKIALSYVLGNLAHSANHFMKMLTNRYTIRVYPGTYIIMVDDAYQGSTRSAMTISGGESFLVSLSLALALSDIGQKITVDTLFIDEGFGTLSEDLLQNAITMLRQLQQTMGRHVGIISHVEELQSKIPTQIRVVQDSHGSSSRIVVVDGVD